MLQDLGVPCVTKMWDLSHYIPCIMYINVIVALVMITVWLDHDTISSIESLVVKGLFGRVLIVGINPSTGI